jgi:hypothetical protein
MSGKYGALIQKAREQENQKEGQPEDKKTIKPDSQISGQQGEEQVVSEPEVNLCVKVPKSLRQHWAAEAKRQGMTMTSVIVEALRAKFGEP